MSWSIDFASYFFHYLMYLHHSRVNLKIEQATTALIKLKPIWRDNSISLGSKVKLMHSLVISIFLYACQSWNLKAELEKRRQVFEMRCYQRLLNILYKDHVTSEDVCRKIQAAIRKYDKLLTLFIKMEIKVVWPHLKVFWL